MITDVPTHKEFYQAGLNLINMSWQNLSMLLLDLDNTHHEDWYEFNENSRSYWLAAQRSLGASLALILQGTEFLLKGKIADVSPYFLIARDISEWPRQCHSEDKAFSEFKTIDAQDLIKVHDTVAISRLPPEFTKYFIELRRTRNALMHTIDQSKILTPHYLLLAILKSTNYLVRPYSWVSLLREFLEEIEPSRILYGYTEEDWRFPEQVNRALKLLQPAEAKKYLNFDKKQRRYMCFDCLHQYEYPENEELFRLVHLRPNEPTSENAYCILCDTNYKVVRVDCNNPFCEGNVIKIDGSNIGICLSCGEELEISLN